MDAFLDRSGYAADKNICAASSLFLFIPLSQLKIIDDAHDLVPRYQPADEDKLGLLEYDEKLDLSRGFNNSN